MFASHRASCRPGSPPLPGRQEGRDNVGWYAMTQDQAALLLKHLDAIAVDRRRRTPNPS